MTNDFVQFADGFWNIRGSFKIGGLLDVGTHCSLVRLSDGSFVFLDSYTLSDAVRAEVDRLTDGGANVAAILNLHPFHTLHCAWMHEAFPHADLYGTARHKSKLPGLAWHDDRCEGDALAERFGDDVAFSVPRGVPLVCEDESVHFSSVLAFHRASGTIHVDDTFNYLDKGFPLSATPLTGKLAFHPTLGKALEHRAGAADEFREWAIDLGIDWADARRIATAHNAALELDGDFPERVGAALGEVKSVLDRHRARHS